MEGLKINEDRFEIGNKNFPLKEIKSQDEYEVQIIIPDNNNESIAIAEINCKILFYWSDFHFFDDKRKKIEKKVNNLEKAIIKLRKFQNEMKGIYHLNNDNNNSKNLSTSKNNLNISKSLNYSKNLNISRSLNYSKNLEWPSEEEVNEVYSINNISHDISHDNLENLKNSNFYNQNLNQNNIHNELRVQQNNALNENNLIENLQVENKSSVEDFTLIDNKDLYRLIPIFGFITSFYKPDFPNELGGLLLLFCMYYINAIKDDKEILFYLDKMFKGVLLLFVYDLIWIFLNIKNSIYGFNQYIGKKENGILKISMLITFCNLFIKGILSFNLYNQIKSQRKK